MTRYAFSFNGSTRFYNTLQEAQHMARFCGVPVSSIAEVSLR